MDGRPYPNRGRSGTNSIPVYTDNVNTPTGEAALQAADVAARRRLATRDPDVRERLDDAQILDPQLDRHTVAERMLRRQRLAEPVRELALLSRKRNRIHPASNRRPALGYCK